MDSGNGKVWYGQFMVMDPTGKQVTLPGVHTTEPTFGLPAIWIEASLKEEASVKGYTVVDSATVLATHLTELIKANMSELLSYGEVQKLLKELPKEQSELIKDIVPSLITIPGVQRVLQILLAERVSIRDLSTILEGIADGLASTRNPMMLAEHPIFTTSISAPPRWSKPASPPRSAASCRPSGNGCLMPAPYRALPSQLLQPIK